MIKEAFRSDTDDRHLNNINGDVLLINNYNILNVSQEEGEVHFLKINHLVHLFVQIYILLDNEQNEVIIHIHE
jgi:hypothetical protein